MRRILTKGFTSLWNLMKLQAKPVVATMRRICLVKSTTGHFPRSATCSRTFPFSLMLSREVDRKRDSKKMLSLLL